MASFGKVMLVLAVFGLILAVYFRDTFDPGE